MDKGGEEISNNSRESRSRMGTSTDAPTRALSSLPLVDSARVLPRPVSESSAILARVRPPPASRPYPPSWPVTLPQTATMLADALALPRRYPQQGASSPRHPGRPSQKSAEGETAPEPITPSDHMGSSGPPLDRRGDSGRLCGGKRKARDAPDRGSDRCDEQQRQQRQQEEREEEEEEEEEKGRQRGFDGRNRDAGREEADGEEPNLGGASVPTADTSEPSCKRARLHPDRSKEGQQQQGWQEQSRCERSWQRTWRPPPTPPSPQPESQQQQQQQQRPQEHREHRYHDQPDDQDTRQRRAYQQQQQQDHVRENQHRQQHQQQHRGSQGGRGNIAHHLPGGGQAQLLLVDPDPCAASCCAICRESFAHPLCRCQCADESPHPHPHPHHHNHNHNHQGNYDYDMCCSASPTLRGDPCHVLSPPLFPAHEHPPDWDQCHVRSPSAIESLPAHPFGATLGDAAATGPMMMMVVTKVTTTTTTATTQNTTPASPSLHRGAHEEVSSASPARMPFDGGIEEGEDDGPSQVEAMTSIRGEIDDLRARVLDGHRSVEMLKETSLVEIRRLKGELKSKQGLIESLLRMQRRAKDDLRRDECARRSRGVRLEGAYSREVGERVVGYPVAAREERVARSDDRSPLPFSSPLRPQPPLSSLCHSRCASLSFGVGTDFPSHTGEGAVEGDREEEMIALSEILGGMKGGGSDVKRRLWEADLPNRRSLPFPRPLPSPLVADEDEEDKQEEEGEDEDEAGVRVGHRGGEEGDCLSCAAKMLEAGAVGARGEGCPVATGVDVVAIDNSAPLSRESPSFVL